jgi:hippurate hydrolase
MRHAGIPGPFRLARLALTAAAQAQASDVAACLGKDIDAQVAAGYSAIDTLYKDLHARPELAFEDVDTARKLGTAMRESSCEVSEGHGKTGLVAMLRNGAGPMIMFRMELAALAMEEKTGLPYREQGDIRPSLRSCPSRPSRPGPRR